ncbi:BamA/TamA family outer membrane protein [Corallococcus sp. RDP092CA]|uniref:BamA/TamA family outer membrane protein n=1 Tax=Corallococcus sp. RDP092CA TaxID=3109369 RepID=UPI0035B25B5F
MLLSLPVLLLTVLTATGTPSGQATPSDTPRPPEPEGAGKPRDVVSSDAPVRSPDVEPSGVSSTEVAAPPRAEQVPEGTQAPEATADAERTKNYEEALIAWGLGEVERQVEPAPEGKVLEEVLVAAEEVVAPMDPYPSLLNLFHVRTRDEVVRQEVLLSPGQPYSEALVAESVRNLRKLGLFSVVRAVPVKGSAPDRVALLLVTKDLWSLRLNNEFSAVGSLLLYLRLQGTEQNFLGRGKKVALDFIMRLDTYSLGQSYTDKRVLGSRWSLTESAAVLINRDTGRAEGSRGSLVVSRPLYSLATPWSLSTSVAWNMETARQYRGADIWQLPFPDGAPVPYVYNAREVAAGATYTRSYGQRYKWNVGLGAGAYHYAYAAPVASQLTDAQADWLRRNYLPRAEDAGYANLSLSAFEARYDVLRNVDSYTLSEDFQLGHSVLATLRYAPPVFPSAAHFVEGGLSLRYRVRWGDALTTASAAASVRQQFSASQPGVKEGWTNRRWAAELVQVSPRVLGGRFVARGLLDVNIDDLSERVSLLGGGNGLRGAAVDAYSGKRLLLVNLEYRTPPVVVHTVHLGGVFFLDSGSAFNKRPELVTTVGVGLRLLFPQFNVFPFRIDFGYVLNGDRPPVGSRLSLSSGQVTEYRPTFLDSP